MRRKTSTGCGVWRRWLIPAWCLGVYTASFGMTSKREQTYVLCRITDFSQHECRAARYTTTTDGNGRYEFELPPGVYDLTANTVPGLWARSGGAGVSPGSCSGLAFEIRSDGMIAGRVKAANGKPLKDAAVTLVPVSGAVGFSAWSKAGDEHGYFEFRGVNPGRYLVGIGIAAQPGSPEWESRVYYPGVRSKEEAVAVGLGEAEKRSDINFQLPNLAAP